MEKRYRETKESGKRIPLERLGKYEEEIERALQELGEYSSEISSVIKDYNRKSFE